MRYSMHTGDPLLPSLPNDQLPQPGHDLQMIHEVENEPLCHAGGEQSFMDHLGIGRIDASATSKQRETSTAYYEVLPVLNILDQQTLEMKEKNMGIRTSTSKKKQPAKNVARKPSSEMSVAEIKSNEEKRAEKVKKSREGMIQWLEGYAPTDLKGLQVKKIIYGDQVKQTYVRTSNVLLSQK